MLHNAMRVSRKPQCDSLHVAREKPVSEHLNVPEFLGLFMADRQTVLNNPLDMDSIDGLTIIILYRRGKFIFPEQLKGHRAKPALGPTRMSSITYPHVMAIAVKQSRLSVHALK